MMSRIHPSILNTSAGKISRPFPTCIGRQVWIIEAYSDMWCLPIKLFIIKNVCETHGRLSGADTIHMPEIACQLPVHELIVVNYFLMVDFEDFSWFIIIR
jgi:hypothetical protein